MALVLACDIVSCFHWFYRFLQEAKDFYDQHPEAIQELVKLGLAIKDGVGVYVSNRKRCLGLAQEVSLLEGSLNGLKDKSLPSNVLAHLDELNKYLKEAQELIKTNIMPKGLKKFAKVMRDKDKFEQIKGDISRVANFLHMSLTVAMFDNKQQMLIPPTLSLQQTDVPPPLPRTPFPQNDLRRKSAPDSTTSQTDFQKQHECEPNRIEFTNFRRTSAPITLSSQKTISSSVSSCHSESLLKALPSQSLSHPSTLYPTPIMISSPDNISITLVQHQPLHVIQQSQKQFTSTHQPPSQQYSIPSQQNYSTYQTQPLQYPTCIYQTQITIPQPTTTIKCYYCQYTFLGTQYGNFICPRCSQINQVRVSYYPPTPTPPPPPPLTTTTTTTTTTKITQPPQLILSSPPQQKKKNSSPSARPTKTIPAAICSSS